MCEYCYCDRRTEEGFLGKQIGGDPDHPVFITKLDNPIDNYLFWLVEGESFLYKDRKNLTCKGWEFFKIVPIHYCPECGCPLI